MIAPVGTATAPYLRYLRVSGRSVDKCGGLSTASAQTESSVLYRPIGAVGRSCSQVARRPQADRKPSSRFVDLPPVTHDFVPSGTLRRAALQERERIERARKRIATRQRTLRDELAELDHQLGRLADREQLLDRLTSDPVSEPAPAEASALKGKKLREYAARVLLREQGPNRPLHYKNWFDLLLAEGVEIHGRDPLANFLTNAARSPLVVRAQTPGQYLVDPDAITRLRSELGERQAELRDVTEVIAREVTPDERLQEHRAQLVSAVRRLEGLIAEGERVLAAGHEPVSVRRLGESQTGPRSASSEADRTAA